MKKAAWQIAGLAVTLLIICVVTRMVMGNTYMAYIPAPKGPADPSRASLRFDAEVPGVVRQGSPETGDGYLRVPIQPQRPGETFLDVYSGPGETLTIKHFRVSRFMTVYDAGTGGFTGDSLVLIAFTVFCLAVAAIMFHAYRQATGPAFYSYNTIYAVGFSLFALLTGIVMAYVTIRHIARPYDYSMMSAYSAICSASFSFIMVTAPLLLLFSLAMIVSNLALLRHERAVPKNVLGIAVALLLLAGAGLCAWLYVRNLSGPEWEIRARTTGQNVYATVFSYFECMLIGVIVCGIRAAWHVPPMDADYLIILGCSFRRDGTLTPLLRGRVDRALDFWRDQRNATGNEAVLVPSGGQGPDEVMAEAEAMRRYLLEQGVPDRLIRVENRSRNTYQNMKYSKALIDSERPGAKAAFVTTNYHVFRSGVWAGLAGLQAEGMGSRTKWWYWPNAFMRECAGLMLNRLRQELLLLLAMVAFFGALSVALI